MSPHQRVLTAAALVVKSRRIRSARLAAPFTDLKADDVQVRLLGDFAVIHAHMTFRTLDGKQHQGRYTDDYQRRDGRWQCVAANVVAEGL